MDLIKRLSLGKQLTFQFMVQFGLADLSLMVSNDRDDGNEHSTDGGDHHHCPEIGLEKLRHVYMGSQLGVREIQDMASACGANHQAVCQVAGFKSTSAIAGPSLGERAAD